MAVSPKKGILAIGTKSNRVALLSVGADYHLSKQLGLEGHRDSVTAVAFSPDGETLASGDVEGRIILWDIASHQPLGQPFTGHKKGVLSMAFSPDGGTLASGGEDNNVILWDVSVKSWQARARHIVNLSEAK